MVSPLTPETVELLESLQALGFPPIHSLTPAEGRSMRSAAARVVPKAEAEPVHDVLDTVIAGPAGDLPVRMYTPSPWTESAGSLVYFHGGGWVFGDLDTHDAPCRGLANASGLRVVAVQYRLSPEAPHPAALLDAWAAVRWMSTRESGPLFVGGDSAGGHIAAGMAARARDSAVEVAGQLLVYPVTDLSRFDTPSYIEYGEGHWLTLAAMEWFRGHYLDSSTSVEDEDVSPLLRADLEGMPPAIFIAAQCDVLCDEGLAYADRLRAAGCDVQYKLYERVVHGFFALPDAIPEGRKAIEDAGAALAALAGAAR